MSDALYIVEYRGISRGVMVLDKMLKRSDIMALYAAPVCIGKYLIAVGGDGGDVIEARAEAEMSDGIIAGYLMTGAHSDVWAILGIPGGRQRALLRQSAFSRHETFRQAS